jgi:hypothetical protein
MILWCAAMLIAVSVAQPSYLSRAQDGWTTLLDGTSLAGWNRVGDANWELVDGAAQATKGAGGYLVTPEAYGDFQLTAEVWASPGANSGIFVRCQDPKEITANNSYEVNIYDTRPDPAYRTGAIVNVAKPMATVNADGKWTSVDITAQGSRLVVVMDGVKTVDTTHQGHVRGPIALQYGQGSAMVRFRNVRVRAL